MSDEPERPKANMRQKVPAPFTPRHLAAFMAALPPDREVAIGVTTYTEGQRDPEVTSYMFYATWEV